MKNIFKKSEKDFKRIKASPKIDNVLSLKGFIKYFLYRNSLPSVRDILYFIIDTLEIFLIYKLIGRNASTGGIIGYFFIMFMASMWKVLVYSMREKILQLDAKKDLVSIPKYFMPLLALGTIFWLILITISFNLIHLDSKTGYLIFIHKALSQIFVLYSTYYFFSTYTLSRVYMPMQYTLINRVFNLVMAVVLTPFIGVYGFIISFYSEKIIDFLIVIKFCNVVLRLRKIKLISLNVSAYIYKNLFWVFREKATLTIKRSSSFFVLNLEKVLVLSLINHYYPFYLIDFFVFYQVINFFMVPANRIAKSLFYDITNLLYKVRINFLRVLFNYNLIIVNLVAIVAVFVFYIVAHTAWTEKWFSIVLEFTIINKWYSVYFLIFFAYGLRLFNQFFLVSESHYTTIICTLLFDYILVAFLFFNSREVIEHHNPMVYFVIKGNVSLLMYVTLFFIYITGIWKKDSIISKVHLDNKTGATFTDRLAFLEKVNKQNFKSHLVGILVFKNEYDKNHIEKYVIDVLENKFNINFHTKISPNTIVFTCPKGSCNNLEYELIRIFRIKVENSLESSKKANNTNQI